MRQISIKVIQLKSIKVNISANTLNTVNILFTENAEIDQLTY